MFFNLVNAMRFLKVDGLSGVCSHLNFFVRKPTGKTSPSTGSGWYHKLGGNVNKLLFLYISFHLTFTEALCTVLIYRIETNVFISGLTTPLCIYYL